MKLNLHKDEQLDLSFESETEQVDFFLLKQVHSAEIIEFSTSLNSREIEADGIYVNSSNFPHFSIAIQTADCLPIVLINEGHFCLIHAGWRGLQSGIISATTKFGSFTRAIIAPAICKDCFEVTEEFTGHFPGSKNFSKGKNLCFDLKQEAIEQLQNCFPNIQIQVSDKCTKCVPEFHSFRENQTKKRNFTVLRKTTSQKIQKNS